MLKLEWERLLRDGSISRRSEETIPRKRGMEYWIAIRVLDGEKYVVGNYTTYPDVPYSEGISGLVFEKLEKVLQFLEENENLELTRLQLHVNL